MSEHAQEHEHEHQHGHPPAEEDVLPSGKIYLVGIVALIVFFFGALAAGIGMKAVERRENPDGPALIPYDTVGNAKIGIVEQRLFEHSNQGPVWREAAHQRLDAYGWVDQQKGIVHIPIDRAMELVEKGARP